MGQKFMWLKRILSPLLRSFAEERRRVVSDWRIMIHARRIAHAENAPLPDMRNAEDIRKELVRRGDIVVAENLRSVFIIDVPYANLLEDSEEQIVQEADTRAAFGFLTALIYHGLSDLTPKEIFAAHFQDGGDLRRIPLGTTPDDWVGLSYPAPSLPAKVRDKPIQWTKIKKSWDFGVTIGYSAGSPIYLTDVERTLLDSLRMPEKCGGIAKVFGAWRQAAGSLDSARLIDYTDRFDIQILRQRVGFLLEKLGHKHPRLEHWRRDLQRGGSIKLVAGEPYSEEYSSEWNLSLNVPPSTLAILEQEGLRLSTGGYPTSLAELSAWRKANNATTEEARRRFVQFVVLTSIASSPTLGSRLALKGGNALHFIYGNPRSTLDLDFTAEGDFPDNREEIASLLDAAFGSAPRQFQVKARCQSVHRNPKNPDRTFPTYRVNVCYQMAGDRQYQNFEQRNNLPVIELEISINDVLCETFEKQLSPSAKPIRVCSLEDILAEKLRALLQQVVRNRSRPQDVYDIASRVRAAGGAVDIAKISDFLLRKSEARAITPRKSSYDDGVRQRAMVNYDPEIRPQAAQFIPFNDAWEEVKALIARLLIPD